MAAFSTLWEKRFHDWNSDKTISSRAMMLALDTTEHERQRMQV